MEKIDQIKNPTTLSNVPDGEYLIRGDKKDHANEYYVICGF